MATTAHIVLYPFYGATQPSVLKKSVDERRKGGRPNGPSSNKTVAYGQERGPGSLKSLIVQPNLRHTTRVRSPSLSSTSSTAALAGATLSRMVTKRPSLQSLHALFTRRSRSNSASVVDEREIRAGSPHNLDLLDDDPFAAGPQSSSSLRTEYFSVDPTPSPVTPLSPSAEGEPLKRESFADATAVVDISERVQLDAESESASVQPLHHNSTLSRRSCTPSRRSRAHSRPILPPLAELEKVNVIVPGPRSAVAARLPYEPWDIPDPVPPLTPAHSLEGDSSSDTTAEEVPTPGTVSRSASDASLKHEPLHLRNDPDASFLSFDSDPADADAPYSRHYRSSQGERTVGRSNDDSQRRSNERPNQPPRRGSGGQAPGGSGSGQDPGDDRNRDQGRGRVVSRLSESTSEDESETEEDGYGEEHPAGAVLAQSDRLARSGSSDDDIPLAQRIPTALEAQKEIQRQARDEREHRRRQRDRDRAISTRESRERRRLQGISDEPPARYERRGVPAADLAKRLMQVQGEPKPERTLRQVPSSTQSPNSGLRHSRTPSRTEDNPLVDIQPPVGLRALRPMRSFHRPTPTLPADVPPLPSPTFLPPLPGFTAQSQGGSSFHPSTRPSEFSTTGLGRSKTAASASVRRSDSGRLSQNQSALPASTHVNAAYPSETLSTSRAQAQPLDTPSDPHYPQALERSRTTTRSHSTAEGAPVVGRPRAISDAGNVRSRLAALSLSTSRPPLPPLPSPDLAQSIRSRTQLEPPTPLSPTLPPSQRVSAATSYEYSSFLPASASSTGSTMRIFIGDRQRFVTVEITPTTRAKDVLEMVEARGELIGEENKPGGYMLWELANDFGMERPIRSFELPSEIYASWNTEKRVNAFMIKKTPLAVLLTRSAIPGVAPLYSGYVEWESKRGKWSKRWMELREHSLSLSKKDNSKDEVFLCSLSNFDAYLPIRKHRSPKTFVFALKSCDNYSLFENPADYFHTFSCDERTGQQWYEKLLVARSYVLQQERTVLFRPNQSSTLNTSAGPGGSGAPSRKYIPTAPLVSVAPPFAGAPGAAAAGTGSTGNNTFEFEPGSLLAKHAS
ncbi:hypothetical protein SISSUDRAFT_1054935 [Sistotremastrum suecicum HHB10207 ss-3]|uniref:PH domain-containing protein n=1 Tax=Sistotremastrum suecicum HHB10207 ss-3 TaxID=1314776 RepID=A0A165Y515_9AGAM|nr:hypothetical protein SISSUDRAFT_1054935 [Sistotremastrum suecicum HHB10207 ss-3]